MKKAIFFSIIFAWLMTASGGAQPFIPPKEVKLSCAPLPYVFDCSISRMPNPQFTSRCFYVADGQSTLMRADHKMGFSNEIVYLRVDASMSVTGTVTENQSGKQAQCEEDS
jgi:hypothetical protein